MPPRTRFGLPWKCICGKMFHRNDTASRHRRNCSLWRAHIESPGASQSLHSSTSKPVRVVKPTATHRITRARSMDVPKITAYPPSTLSSPPKSPSLSPSSNSSRDSSPSDFCPATSPQAPQQWANKLVKENQELRRALLERENMIKDLRCSINEYRAYIDQQEGTWTRFRNTHANPQPSQNVKSEQVSYTQERRIVTTEEAHEHYSPPSLNCASTRGAAASLQDCIFSDNTGSRRSPVSLSLASIPNEQHKTQNTVPSSKQTIKLPSVSLLLQHQFS